MRNSNSNNTRGNYNSSNSNSNNTRGVKRTLRSVNARTAKRMMTKRFMNKVNDQLLKEAARHGITNLNATKILFYDKGLTKIPDFVFLMKNLKELELEHNNITSLPAAIGQLKNLERLELEESKLTSLPATIGQLKNLKYLSIWRSNRLTSLPESIGKLKNLKSLELSGNKLTSLPESIGQLKNLEELDVSHNNELTSLPESIGRLKNLEFLKLSNQPIASLPDSFKNLPNSLEIMIVDAGRGYSSGILTKQQYMKKFQPSGPTYENKNLPTNATNLFSLNAFKKGDKVMKYGVNKYMKVSDFTRYLNTPRGGEMIFNQFFNANGNKKFFAPNGVPFRRGNVKFYKFV